MASMYPSGQEEFPTAGEKAFYEFLKQAAKPDSAFMAWYSPDVESREPDFILYAPGSGLLVLEVKDWLPAQILEADPKTALLQIGKKQERRKQPLAQAREYAHGLLSLLRKHARKWENGKPEIPLPILEGAVFPHMRRDEFLALGLGKVMDTGRIFFWDEIRPGSALLADKSGEKFRAWLAAHFPPLFSFSMSPADLDWLRGCLFPVARIRLPQRSPGQTDAERILALDKEQENLARTLGPGRLLLEGPAGCGKTLVLAHQAGQLARTDKKARRMLFTCFNFSLVGYIKRLLAARQISLGPDNVEVLPFYGLCERILGEKLSHAGEDTDYYSLIVQEALDRLAGDHPLKGYWDAVFVDEGQDFTPQMVRVLLCVASSGGTFSVAVDEHQTVYTGGGNPWPALLGNPKRTRLERQYRNCPEIARLAAAVLWPESGQSFAAQGKKAGSVTRILAPSPAEMAREIARVCRGLCEEGIPMSEIAVLYARSSIDGAHLPELIMQELERQGLLGRWSSGNAQSKLHYDITTDSITISTIHSAKGLDYAQVFLLGLETLNPSNALHRHLAHVGITRARSGICICSCAEGGLAGSLESPANNPAD